MYLTLLLIILTPRPPAPPSPLTKPSTNTLYTPQPAWGIRLILEALISFFPSPSQGALGGLDWTPEERRWVLWSCGGLATELTVERKAVG